MNDDGNGGGKIAYTVKDLLANIDQKLDALNTKLDTKADAARLQDVMEYTHSVERRLTQVEATMVRREGPIITEFREFERRVELLETTVTAKIQEAIAASNEKSFSFREKIGLVAFAAVGALGTLVSTAVLIVQTTHHL